MSVSACHDVFFFQLISIVFFHIHDWNGRICACERDWMRIRWARWYQKEQNVENNETRRTRIKVRPGKTAGDWNSWIMPHDILWRSFHYCDIDKHTFVRSFVRFLACQLARIHALAWFALISLLYHITITPSSKIIPSSSLLMRINMCFFSSYYYYCLATKIVHIVIISK